MKKYRKLFALLLVFSFLASCSSNDKEEVFSGTFKNLICCYIIPQKLDVTYGSSEPTGMNLETYQIPGTPGHDLRVIVSGGNIDGGEAFKQLAKRYGDTHYNRGLSRPLVAALEDSIKSISVVTLTDYDAEHPAGSDVSGLMECGWACYYDFIKNDYKRTGNMDSLRVEGNKTMGYDHPDIDICRFHRTPLKEVGVHSTLLATQTFVFYFIKKPTTTCEHRFRMTFHFTSADVSTEFTKND